MNQLRVRSLIVAALVAIGLLFVLSAAATAENEKPREAHVAAAETSDLRKEVDALRRRIERLENPGRVDASKAPVEEPGEKERLVAETQEILAHFKQGKSLVWKEAHGRIRELRLQLAASLTELQDGYTRRAMLNEAVAIREATSFIKEPARMVVNDPGLLRTANEPSRVLFFRVTGAKSGSVYGTDVYTSDSSLAAAAVHAGVLKVGQTGIVKVTTIPSHPSYLSTTRNEITSSAWGSYPGFRVEALGDEDQELNDGNMGEAADGKMPAGQLCPPVLVTDSPKMAPGSDPAVVCKGGDLAALPADARERIEQFNAKAAEIRAGAWEQVRGLARKALGRIVPIQDAHTRAARLDDAIATRDAIRWLKEYAGKQSL